jgi:hypothetical protein
MHKFTKICKTIVFDSAKNKTITVNFTKDLRWTLMVKYIRFTLNTPQGDVPWSDMVAYLNVEATGSTVDKTVFYPSVPKVEGVAFPIAYPEDGKARVDAMIKGACNRGVTIFTPKILDADMNVLDTSRIVLYLLLEEEV